VPRARRPRRIEGAEILDETLAEAANFSDPAHPKFLKLKQEATGLVDHYRHNTWKDHSGDPPGQREVEDRDKLIDDLEF
jgi:hypothetical protein